MRMHQAISRSFEGFHNQRGELLLLRCYFFFAGLGTARGGAPSSRISVTRITYA
jgi:hypothetical protein